MKLRRTMLVPCLVVVGCAPSDGPDVLAQSHAPFLSPNGLNVNGLNVNGLNVNGLNVNGLNVNGLGSDTFVDWFNNADDKDYAQHAETMRYLVGCTLRPDQSTEFTDENGTVYTWTGVLGVAPGWFWDAPTDTDKQWVSACLMAHVNTARGGPKHIELSVRGDNAGLDTDERERGAVDMFEGVFFGDLFASPPALYVCAGGSSPGSNFYQSLLRDWGRQCVMQGEDCGQFARVSCDGACTPSDFDTTGYHYSSCSIDGQSYPAVNVYLPHTTALRKWRLMGWATSTPCDNCLDGEALDNLEFGGWNGAYTYLEVEPGTYLFDFRYANGTDEDAYAGFQVNDQDLMDDSTDTSGWTNYGSDPNGRYRRRALWQFPPTSGNDVWEHRTFQVNIPTSGARIAIVGPNWGMRAPRVDALSIWIP